MTALAWGLEIAGATEEAERKPDRRTALTEADMEYVAFLHEVLHECEAIVQAELAQDIPSGWVIQRATKLARKALLAKGEIKRLRGER